MKKILLLLLSPLTTYASAIEDAVTSATVSATTSAPASVADTSSAVSIALQSAAPAPDSGGLTVGLVIITLVTVALVSYILWKKRRNA